MPDYDRLILPYSSGDADKDEGLIIKEMIARSKNPIPDPDQWLQGVDHGNVVLSTVDAVLGWARKRSLWPA